MALQTGRLWVDTYSGGNLDLRRFPSAILDVSIGDLDRSCECLLEGIQDGHVEVREITFVPSGHGEAMNARRGAYHSILT